MSILLSQLIFTVRGVGLDLLLAAEENLFEVFYMCTKTQSLFGGS